MNTSYLTVQSMKLWVRVRRWFWVPALAALSVFLVLTAAEGILREFHLQPPGYVTRELYRDINNLYLPHQKAVWCGNLGQVRDFCNTVRTNALTFHDTDHTLRKPGGTYRILFLGDSYLEAHQVPLGKTFFKTFEDWTRRKSLPVFGGKQVETISLGRSGNGAFREFAALKEVGLAFEPDMVVVLLTDQNDFDDDWHHERIRKGIEAKPTVNLKPPQAVFDKLAIYRNLLQWPDSWVNQWFAFLWTEFLGKADRDARNEALWKDKLWIFAKPDSALFKDTEVKRREALAVTALYYHEMKRLADAAGASFHVVFVDRSYDARMSGYLEKIIPGIQSQIDLGGPVSVMKRFFTARGISFVDLEDSFGRAPGAGRGTRFAHDVCWNAAGHLLAAKALWDYFGRLPAGIS